MGEDEGSATSKKIRLIYFVVGLAVFLYLLIRLGAERIFGMMSRIGWSFFTVLLFYAVYQLLRGAALRICFLGKPPITYGEAFWIRMSGESVRLLTFTGPFLAEPAKAWLLQRRRGIASGEAFAGTLAEYFSYTFCSAGMSIVALRYLRAHFELPETVREAALVVLMAMAVFLAGAAAAVVFRLYLIGLVVKGVASLPLVRSRLRLDMEQVHRTEDLLIEIFRDRPGRFLSILTLEILAQGFLVLELYWILSSLELSFPPYYPLLIEGVIKFVSLGFFFVPTQIGASEAVYAAVFEALGYAASTGFAVSFLRRLRNLVTAGAGLTAMALLGRK